MTVLTIENLSAGYANESVLNELNLTIENDEILCLLGASGCGKTTLLKAIAGLQQINNGKILWRLQDLSQQSVEQRRIGLIFQDYALFPHLNVAENICFGIQDKKQPERVEILQKMIELVHLEGLEQRYPHELSGGQQQRVAIARALACQPRLLLLDEPFSNIDTQVRYQMIDEIKMILKQQGIAAIFVTHSKEEAFAFADKLAIMKQGKIVQIGSCDQLYQRPNSQFVAEFLGNCNYLSCELADDYCLLSALGEMRFDQQLSLANGRKAPLKTKLNWMLRPQHLSMQADNTGNGKIVSRVFLGQYYQYQVEIAGCTLKIQHVEDFSIGQKRFNKLSRRIASFIC